MEVDISIFTEHFSLDDIALTEAMVVTFGYASPQTFFKNRL